ETVSAQLADGTLVQVGKSTEAREDLLARFRAALGLVTLFVVVVALTGGWVAPQAAVAPGRPPALAGQRIIRTGRTDARVPVEGSGDALDELTALFNTMLDKIEGLVGAMRGALDNVSHDLRTPLTRLRGTAEMALASPPDLDRYREALADCVEESDRVYAFLGGRGGHVEASPRTGGARRRCRTRGRAVSRRRRLEAGDARFRRERRCRRHRRSHAARAGRRQFNRQRREVHAAPWARGRRGPPRWRCGNPARPRHGTRHFGGRASADFRSSVPRRCEPNRARPRRRAQPHQGDRRSARWNGSGRQRTRPRSDVHRVAAARLKPRAPSCSSLG